MTRESKLMCAIFTVCVAFPASSAAQQCLHGADESADEKGRKLTLNKTDNGYWFMIKDKTDPCGFAFISNQQGLIYTAEPIR